MVQRSFPAGAIRGATYRLAIRFGDKHMTSCLTAAPATTAALPLQFHARISGKVQHRVGDGMLHDIPQGQKVHVDTALASMVVSWHSDGQPVTVTLAREEFLFYVDEGRIEVLG
ncbi:MAG TPA: hypothetical protein DEF75_07490 [Comamonas kerstersii]|nr:hypothetical protein [Comamonas kerstersii]